MKQLALFLVAAALAQPPPPRPDLFLRTPDLTVRVRDKRGRLVRSRSRVCLFLRMAGHVKPGAPCRVPAGMRGDHHIPLDCGGADIPSNFALLTIAEHAAKSRWERQPCSAWWDGTNTRLLQHAIDGCRSGATPAALCAGRPTRDDRPLDLSPKDARP